MLPRKLRFSGMYRSAGVIVVKGPRAFRMKGALYKNSHHYKYYTVCSPSPQATAALKLACPDHNSEVLSSIPDVHCILLDQPVECWVIHVSTAQRRFLQGSCWRRVGKVTAESQGARKKICCKMAN